MKRLSTEKNAQIPSHVLSYLVNGDASGITVEEKAQADNFMKLYSDLFPVNGGIIISPVGEASHYSKFPEFGLPCLVVDCDIIVMEKEDTEERDLDIMMENL